MRVRGIEILGTDGNSRGDLFCRLMGDLFHALGYDDEPRFNIHKSGRELDLYVNHRTEKKIAVAECKAHEEPIGGSDINKFVGVLDAENRKIKNSKEYGKYEGVGYFVSLSGFTETAVEQEQDLGNERLILMKSSKVIGELVAGKIIVPIEKAISCVSGNLDNLILADHVDLFAYSGGWVWGIYYSDGQRITHFALVHAEGKPLVTELANKVIELDDALNRKLHGLAYIAPSDENAKSSAAIEEAKKKYFKYIENECGEIQFEGLPTDKDSGSVKVRLENIFVPLHLEKINKKDEKKKAIPEQETRRREGIGNVLEAQNRIAILAKPGGGKSTLIKRLAIAYAYPERRELINDELPARNWFPIFIRCRELGEKVTASITDIINNIPYRAEISHCSREFAILASEALQKGNALLLIDGLDEIADDRSRMAFVNQLRTFLATYPNTNIIATSREPGFRVVSGSIANYCSHYQLSSLSNAEIEDLTIRWHKAIVGDSDSTVKEAKSLSRFILKDNRIRVLAENPLLLTTLLFVKRWAGYLPTKKSVLYQEMIKLLLVTWNVEGHEQLDIDETEPQLAFVAFWMTSNGQQTITLEELKDCLFSARKQMPDILGYTKISVSDFIKRVESRSSLLIMSGHRKLDSGQITPIYEFLHLSFQEYLTAKAIVERHISAKDSKRSILAILRPHVKNEAWKEIFSLVAVLSKRGAKELIEYLISASMKIAEETARPPAKERILSPPELLGNCIASEPQITPDLLEAGLEWYAKNRYNIFDQGLIEILRNGKFGDVFESKVRDLFFKKFDDKYSSPVGGMLGELHLIGMTSTDYNFRFSRVSQEIRSNNREEKCIGILSLMHLAYRSHRPAQHRLEPTRIDGLQDIHEIMLEALTSDDLHCYFSSCWATAWMAPAGIFLSSFRIPFVESVLDGWIKYDHQYNLCHVSSWVLSEILSPTVEIATFTETHCGLKERIVDKYKNSQNEFDKIAAAFVGINLNIVWTEAELKTLFNEQMKGSRAKSTVVEYASYLGLELSKKEGTIRPPSTVPLL